MQTAAASYERRRFTEIDFLMLSLFAAMACMTLHAGANAFSICTMMGGVYLIGMHFFEVYADGAERQNNLAIAATAPAGFMAFGVALKLMNRSLVTTYDRQLAWLDHGIAPAVRAWALHHHSVYNLVELAYLALPIAMLVGLAESHGGERRTMLRAMVLGGLLAPLWYIILPAVGPAHVGQPWAPRNCMPSMHCTWALVVFTNSRGKARWIAGGFAAITALATLTTGEHYTPDLVAALPWTWVLNRLAGKGTETNAN
jgi:hypothetical protein